MRNHVQFSRNESEKKTQFAGTRTHDLKLIRFTWIPTRPPGRPICSTAVVSTKEHGLHLSSNSEIWRRRYLHDHSSTPPKKITSQRRRTTHRREDTKDNLERGLVEEAVERIRAYELLEICLSLEPPDVPPPCPCCKRVLDVHGKKRMRKD